MTTPRPTTTNFDIMKTADDAVRVKAAAVASGYYDDPYIHEFLDTGGPAHNKRPVHVIIKRGTFARVQCVERVIRSFLHHAIEAATKVDDDEEEEEETEEQLDKISNRSVSDPEASNPPQIILLGAGKDTALFRLRDHEIFGSETVRWFEVDQVDMIRQKIHVLTNKPDVFHSHGLSPRIVDQIHTSQDEDGPVVLKEIYVLPKVATSSYGDWTAHYIAHDFVQDHAQDLMAALVQQCHMKPHAPTLILTECVQMYLPITAVDDLMQCFLAKDALTNVTICSYEPILQSDVFGKVMETNLRNSHLLTDDAACVLLQRRTIVDLLQALQDAGATLGVATDMKTAYETVLTKSQQDRARRSEFLDELEEWNLIMKHYCLIVATNNQNNPVGKALCGKRSAVGFPDNDQSVHRFG